jgi:hypothetical protein
MNLLKDLFATRKIPDQSLIELMHEYSSFDQIPERLRSEYHLIAWLRTVHGSLEGIPLPLVTDTMRAVFIRNTGSFGPIDASNTPNYQALALEAVQRSPGMIMAVDRRVITEEFMLKAIAHRETGPMVLWNVLNNWDDRFLHAITQRVMDYGLSRSLHAALMAAMTFPGINPIPKSIREMVTDEQLSLALIDNTYELGFLKDMGKLHLLTQAFADGYWPSKNDEAYFNTGPLQFRFHKPTLAQAIEERITVKNGHSHGQDFDNKALRLFFGAFIQTFAIDEVLAHCRTPAHVKMLEEMYSREQIRPFLKSHSVLKALLLEDALGL